MSVDMGRNRLFKDLEELRRRWNVLERVWQDAVRDEFAKEHLVPLEGSVLTTLAAADRIAPVLQQLRQECGEGEAGA